MANLAKQILAGAELPAAAIGHPELYDSLKRGEAGPKPILGSSMKVEKGEGQEILTRILYMMPARSSGKESCGGRSAGCTASCLSDTGRLGMDTAQNAMRWKHAAFYADRARFLSDLATEIGALERKARKLAMIPAVRLNGTTDIPWERYELSINGMSYPSLMHAFPNVQFYDYTKLAFKHRSRAIHLSNYHLTFSLSERADAELRASDYIAAGYSVAVVFACKKGELPGAWALEGAGIVPVIDGDKHDARFLDEPASIVGLTAKGRAKKDSSGFVRAIQ